MNGVGGLALTPRSRFRTAQDSTQNREIDHGSQLTLRSVIGTTTTSNNAFDANPEYNVFAYCAGPAVIISKVDEELNVSQRLFRSKHSASPINGTSSFYNPITPPTTPSRSRHGSPLKEGSYGSDEISASPGSGRVGTWNREATCISLSRGGRFLAVGETGYNPRVLIFSTVPDSPTDVPLSVLTDHTFGVQSIAFSPDSRWLCSLGNSFDGFLLLYNVNPKSGSAKLHSSNKCSNVSSLSWMGNTLITVGARHVKVWRPEKAQVTSPSKGPLDLASSTAVPPGSPGPKTLSGRNCLLGSLLDATFNCIVPISDSKAVLCTLQGDICLLDDTEKSQKLERVTSVSFGIQCAFFDAKHGLVWVAGQDQQARAFPINQLTSLGGSMNAQNPSSGSALPEPLGLSETPSILAIGSVRSHIVTSDSERNVRLMQVEQNGEVCQFGATSKHLPAHESAVLGVCELQKSVGSNEPDFLTYSARGTVLFWLLSGICSGRTEVRLDQAQPEESGDVNELKVVVVSTLNEFLYSGDKRGVLRITNRSGKGETDVQAHNGDINDIVIGKSENEVLVASCGRDRVIQVYRMATTTLELIQTLDDHAATISSIILTDDGSSLLSISSDRSVLVRKIARVEGKTPAFVQIRVITLKATPVSFGLVPSEPENVVVSTMDRQVQKYDIRSGRLLNSFRAQDPSTGETVLVNSLELHKTGDEGDDRAILFGASSVDKAIRIHDCSSGLLLSREQGHTAVSATKIIVRKADGKKPSRSLISCGLDGTISIWDVGNSRPGQDSPSRAESPLRSTPVPSHPARKTLSQAEIRKFQKSLESEEDGIAPIRSKLPSRIRKKTSRYSLAETRRSTLAPISTANNTPTPLSRKTSDDYSSSPAASKNIKTLRTRRPSLDHRRRSKSVANLNDLNDSAEKLSKSIQAFRERVDSSVSDKLNPGTVQDLQNELKLALRALSEKTSRDPVVPDLMTGEPFDSYLAKKIDERLALRDKAVEGTETKP